MVSAALLDQQYVMVEESVVDDQSERTNKYSVSESFLPTDPELVARVSMESDQKPLNNVKSFMQDNNMYL